MSFLWQIFYNLPLTEYNILTFRESRCIEEGTRLGGSLSMDWQVTIPKQVRDPFSFKGEDTVIEDFINGLERVSK